MPQKGDFGLNPCCQWSEKARKLKAITLICNDTHDLQQGLQHRNILNANILGIFPGIASVCNTVSGICVPKLHTVSQTTPN